MWPLTKPKVRHALILGAFVPSLLLSIYWITIGSEDYIEATQFIGTEGQISAAIGPVKKINFRFFRGFESGGGRANYKFRVEAEKGVFDIEVFLRRSNNTWRVQTVNVHDLDGSPRHVIAVDPLP